jgi:hypothetical protein
MRARGGGVAAAAALGGLHKGVLPTVLLAAAGADVLAPLRCPVALLSSAAGGRAGRRLQHPKVQLACIFLDQTASCWGRRVGDHEAAWPGILGKGGGELLGEGWRGGCWDNVGI